MRVRTALTIAAVVVAGSLISAGDTSHAAFACQGLFTGLKVLTFKCS